MIECDNNNVNVNSVVINAILKLVLPLNKTFQEQAPQTRTLGFRLQQENGTPHASRLPTSRDEQLK